MPQRFIVARLNSLIDLKLKLSFCFYVESVSTASWHVFHSHSRHSCLHCLDMTVALKDYLFRLDFIY